MRTQALRCALVTRSSPRAPIVAGKMLHALTLLYLDATVDGERAGAGPLAPRIVAAERRNSIVLRPRPNQRRHTVTLTVPKHIHEIRDPIHTFVRLDSYERAVLDSGPFQRLRHIHQLALTYLVYPGATHKRFEHSLGVMELASRVFDIVTKPTNVTDPMIRHRLPQLDQDDDLRYWRRVLRMAALCHDVGHLPFSHAGEKDLLPRGWDHERITRALITSATMESIWASLTPPLRSQEIVKLALGPKKASDLIFSDWESILSEVIVGDAFGVDRMDYLLRDSHHVGVAYGKFDHYRLIDTLRILPTPTDNSTEDGAPALGLESGGIQSAEALMFARYFMYSQVYFHAVRRIYDIHLMDFLRDWLPKGQFSTVPSDHLTLTDNEVTAAFIAAAADDNSRGHAHARRIVNRHHFKVVYERNPDDVAINPDAGSAVCSALGAVVGTDNVRRDAYQQRSGAPEFPVKLRDDTVVSSLALSETLRNLPVVSVDYVFVARARHAEARQWLKKHRTNVIQPRMEGDGE